MSATGVLTHLEQSLNRMWEIAEADVGIVATIRERLSSLLMVIVLGAFLLVSVTFSTAVTGFAETLTSDLPVGEWTVHLVNVSLSLTLLTLLFAATMKVVPDAVVAWSEVWLGAAVTAVLFVVGQYALSVYLGKSAPGSAYGAAGSVVAFVVWVYYSALILFLGAEFTQVYANRFGSHVQPDDSAVALEEKVQREQSHPGREPAADDEHGTPSRGRRAGQKEADAGPIGHGQGAGRVLYYRYGTRGVEAETGRKSNEFRFCAVAVLAVVALAYWMSGKPGDAA